MRVARPALVALLVVAIGVLGAGSAMAAPLAAQSTGPGFVDQFLNLTVDGLVVGAIIAITSIGLSLIFGVTGLVNFAHGEIVTFGAVVALLLNFGGGLYGPGMHIVFATLIAIVLGGGLGYGLERGLFARLRRRKVNNVSLIVVTIGLSLVLRYITLIWFGGGVRKYADYAVQQAVDIGPVSITPVKLGIIGISAVVLGLVGLLLQKTKLGTGMRAVADNRALAEASGINVRQVILTTWVAGSALAALGGVFQGIGFAGVTWDLGFRLLLLMFAGIILGGLGTAYGAMVGGFLIGVVTQVSTIWLSSEFKLVIAFLILIVVLLFRPQGILGRRERIG